MLVLSTADTSVIRSVAEEAVTVLINQAAGAGLVGFVTDSRLAMKISGALYASAGRSVTVQACVTVLSPQTSSARAIWSTALAGTVYVLDALDTDMLCEAAPCPIAIRVRTTCHTACLGITDPTGTIHVAKAGHTDPICNSASCAGTICVY